MPLYKITRFNEGLERAREWVKAHWSELGDQVILVRDLYGRVRIVLSNEQEINKEVIDELKEQLGAFGVQHQPILYGNQLYDKEAIFDSPDKQILEQDAKKNIFLLDRQLTAQDWNRPPLKRESTTPRFTFFGLKGGVGRSTTLVIWAWRLARQGKKVLVLDFDLESPGLGSTLLPVARYPEFGIVDWFVEDAVRQADDALVQNLVAASPLSDALTGEIRVAPAWGTETGDYIPKLSRSYLEPPIPGGQWAERVTRLIRQLEDYIKPDVIFIDSRAGLHDISAVTVTRLGADALLFAANSEQTWTGYGLLFQHWKKRPELLVGFRDHLKMVAALVPETGADIYLKSFRQNAYRLFSDNLYEEAAPDDQDAFNFDITDEAAPHSPLRVNWHRALQEFDPIKRPENITDSILQAAFGDFWQATQDWIQPEAS